MKLCSGCQLEKSKSEFHARSDRRSGTVSKCKECVRKDHKKTKIKQTYGLCEKTYYGMVDIQKNLCYICNNPEPFAYRGRQRALAVDHCHTSGAVRKLLCTKCNTTLGLVNEDTDILLKMVEYIKEHTQVGLHE